MHKPRGPEDAEMWQKAVHCINETRLVICLGVIQSYEGDAMWQYGLQPPLDRAYRAGLSFGREQLEPILRNSIEFMSENPELAAESTGQSLAQVHEDLATCTLALDNLDEAIAEANLTKTPIDPAWLVNVGLMPPSRFQ